MWSLPESAANGPTFDGFENYKYFDLAEISCKVVDLDRSYEYCMCLMRGISNRVREIFQILCHRSYIISPTRLRLMKKCTVVTLSLKNIIFGAPIKDAGFAFGKGTAGRFKERQVDSSRRWFRGINYNLYDLAPRLIPTLLFSTASKGWKGTVQPAGLLLTTGSVLSAPTGLLQTGWLLSWWYWFRHHRLSELLCTDRIGRCELNKIENYRWKYKNHIKPYKLSTSIENSWYGWRGQLDKSTIIMYHGKNPHHLC